MIARAIMRLRIYLRNSQVRNMADVTFEGYRDKLKGRIYGVLCEKEKNGEWEKFVDSIINELMGLQGNSINWWPLIGKLSALRYMSYEYFRKTIFECLNLVGGLEEPDLK